MACAKRVDGSGRYVGDAGRVAREGKKRTSSTDRKDGWMESSLVTLFGQLSRPLSCDLLARAYPPHPTCWAPAVPRANRSIRPAIHTDDVPLLSRLHHADLHKLVAYCSIKRPQTIENGGARSSKHTRKDWESRTQRNILITLRCLPTREATLYIDGHTNLCHEDTASVLGSPQGRGSTKNYADVTERARNTPR